LLEGVADLEELVVGFVEAVVDLAFSVEQSAKEMHWEERFVMRTNFACMISTHKRHLASSAWTTVGPSALSCKLSCCRRSA